ncbi:hypothetical protein BRADI_2g35724v3 [Brachypodium distachyon]|uniref:Ubiquitin-like protease family profile domain-containing protein n=1 Tax=Brachypodium distachyon TaxID=15368 RepID=A0A2K2DC08_BRADI|nr:hypothetical protein BRADI_2g35724v3 [Brachypodium distachyon]
MRKFVSNLIIEWCDQPQDGSVILFGQKATTPLSKTSLTPSRMSRDPWVVGSIPRSPPPVATLAIVDWMTRAPMSVLARNWIFHVHPRLLKLDGSQIRQQLVGSHPLCDDMCSLLMRRLGQIDAASSKDSKGKRWWKIMEPDFSQVIVLSNIDPLSVQSIHNQFISDAREFNPVTARMYVIPTQIEDCWCVYHFDMLEKCVHVLDPSAGTDGFSNRQLKLHQFVSDKLLTALFVCVKAFYDNWSCGTDGWTRRFPIIISENFKGSVKCATLFFTYIF